MPLFQIRLTLEQWTNVKSFLEEVKEQQHWDVEYTYHKLCFHRAFQFTAAGKEKVGFSPGWGTALYVLIDRAVLLGSADSYPSQKILVKTYAHAFQIVIQQSILPVPKLYKVHT